MACHPKIAARFDVVLDTVRRAPPQGLERHGFDSPQIAVIDGLTKKSGEKFSHAEYKRAVRDVRDDYLANFPRRVAK
jgi:hypothetical protein